ncbi:MAG: GNAT family N-acetyltransferase [Candidatus Bipolaricaulis sp.]|nr:GNAT family N-acetyltransferase [Candidatus Bipolaricaulis sp.]MDD5264826.1 GNAT family N-acetyltransferase [Candidatus Bipolaricaulis sp.]
MGELATKVYACETRQQLEESEALLGAVYEGLGENILEHCGPIELGRIVRVLLRDPGGKVVGGIDGLAFGGWVYIKIMWVAPALRNQGHGGRLLAQLEKEAVRLGCRNAHVDTYSFEARPFYQKHGYEVFATLDEFPPGHQKHFLRKRLA